MIEIDRERLRAELLRMQELIASDPEVLARFDTDGNGVIDSDEWGAVRQLVIRRLEREAMEAHMAAEMARLEADIAAESDPVDEAPSGERDWANLELAFDPRADARSREHSLAEELYEKEVHRRFAPQASRMRVGEHGTLADRRVLVLEQGGSVKQLFGKLFRRTYFVRDADGNELGRVGQRENEAMQELTDYSIFTDPDLNFRVHDEVGGEDFQLRRSRGLASNSIEVLNPRGTQIATTSWQLAILRSKFEVRVRRAGVSYYVRNQPWRPWTYDVLDPFEERIGTMQRGWSGLGFLTGGNLFHIELEQRVEPDVMWGLLATALLADISNEGG